MVDYIRSKSIKEYLKQDGAELTDLYKAVLILRTDCPMEMIHESLEEIAENTVDEELKTAVREKIKEQRLEAAAVKKEQDGTVYTLEVYEPDEEKYINEGYYTSYESAEKHARCFSMEHIIRKYRLFGEEDIENHFHDKFGFIMSELGGLLLNYEGKVLKCLSGIHRTGEGSGSDILDSCCPILRHPFRKGDIVKNLITEQTGIVNDCECTLDEWMKRKERAVSEGDSRNAGILVEYADPVGNFFQMHTFPYDLEYAEESACACSARRNVLKAAQSLIRSTGSLERFTDCRARLEAKKRYW